MEVTNHFLGEFQSIKYERSCVLNCNLGQMNIAGDIIGPVCQHTTTIHLFVLTLLN